MPATSGWGIVKTIKQAVGLKKEKEPNQTLSPKRPSIQRRSSLSKGPRLSKSSLDLAGIKGIADKTDDSNEKNDNIKYKSNPISNSNSNSRSNIDADRIILNDDIKVSVKSVSPGFKGNDSEKSNNRSIISNNSLNLSNSISNLHKTENQIELKEVNITAGAAGSELIGLRISIFNPRTQKWLDGIILSFNADRHRICFDDGAIDDYFLPSTKCKLEEVAANMINSGKLRRTSIIKADQIEIKSTEVAKNNEMNSIKKLIESRKSITISLENISSTLNDGNINTSSSVKRGSVILDKEPPIIASKSVNSNAESSKIENAKTLLPFSRTTQIDEKDDDDDDDDEEEETRSRIPFQSFIEPSEKVEPNNILAANILAANIPPPPPSSSSETAKTINEISDCLFSIEVDTKNGKDFIYYREGQDPDRVAEDFVQEKGLSKDLVQTLGIAIKEKYLETLKLVLTSRASSLVTEEWAEANVETSWSNPNEYVDSNAWQEANDEYGNRYYYNTITGETSWSNPNESIDSNTWQEANDEYGNRYYYNTITGESSWSNPNESIDSNAWQEANDEYGNRYYYNTITGETSWSNPNESIDN